jgi:Flp pilus assembly protein TadG
MKLTTFYVNGAMRVIKGIGISVAPREACPKEILRGRGKRRQERGSSFVEFALVSLIFIPLFFGVLDYSRVFYYASVAQGAARAGTQYAVFSQPNETNSSGTTVTATATYWCLCTGTTYSTSNTNTCPTTNPCGTGVTNQVYSQVDTTVSFNTFFKAPMLPSAMTLRGRSIMRVQ